MTDSSLHPSPQPAPQGSGSSRYDGLDAVRAFAMLLGVAYHAAYAWLPDVGRWYFVADPSPVPSLVFFVGFSHAWRMQLFFALSGFFAHLVFERRGPRGFLRDRARRLLTPLVVALPLTLLVDWAVRDASQRHGLMAAAYEPGAAFRFLPLHLWFVLYLFSYCLAAWALPALGWPARAFHALLRVAPRLLLFAVLTCLLLWAHPDNRPDQHFWPMPFEWLHYGGFFFFGWLLWAARAEVASLRRAALLMVVVGVGLGAVLYGTHLQWSLAGQVAAGVVAWCMTLAALGLAFAWPSRATSSQRVGFFRFLTDSAYWVYLTHYPLILALQLFFAGTSLDGRLEFALCVGLALGALFALYAVAVRGRAWARALGVSN